MLTQSDVNKSFFSSVKHFQNIHTIEMPDYTRSLNRYSSNTNLKVVYIGSLHAIKGFDIVKRLSRKCNLFVLGNVHNDDKDIPHKKYNSIKELNQLLIIHKPNVIVFPYLWPETYSYTLTLSLISKIPIIIKAQTWPDTISSRCINEKNVHFNDFTDLDNVIELANSIKSDHFYTIDDCSLNVSRHWYNILNPVVYNLVIIPSKIKTSNNKLYYCESRSRFSVKTRFEQTLKTFVSIRKYIPHSYIVFCDDSDFTSDELSILNPLVDVFITESQSYYTDVCSQKAIAECMHIQNALDVIENNHIIFNNVFKITGRYHLNSHFDYAVYDNLQNVFKRADTQSYKKLTNYIYTSFYKIHKTYINDYKQIIHKVISELCFLDDAKIPFSIYGDFETKFAQSLPSIKLVNTLGLTQQISPHETEDICI
jgi:hypothetical protein